MIWIQLALLKELGCGIQMDTPCDAAYDKFLSCYSKTFSAEAKLIFCQHLDDLKQVIETCDSCSVTAIADQKFTTMPLKTELQSLQSIPATDTCQKFVCAATLTDAQMPLLSQVYTSVNLVEAGLITGVKNQGTYGDCWAFTTTAVLENSILLDKANLNMYWQAQAAALDLSEAFIAINVRGNNHYQNGGSFPAAMNYIQQDPAFSTIEIETNYPYASMPAYVTGYAVTLPFLIAAANYLKPFKTFSISPGGVEYQTPTVAVVMNNPVKFTTTDIKQIKSYLTRGMALQLAIYASPPTFISYDGGLLSAPCTSPVALDHSVTLVGYGTYKNKEVWVIKNQYGVGWGASGYGYLPIGEDSYCSEHEAYTIIPKSYVATAGKFTLIGNQVRGGLKELDKDFGQTEDNSGVPDPMKPVSWTINDIDIGNQASAVVVVKDKAANIVYSGNGVPALTQTMNARSLRFPLTITVSATNYNSYTQTSIQDFSNVIITMVGIGAQVFAPVKYVVNVNGLQFSGSLQVVFKDNLGNNIYSGPLATFQGSVITKNFPLIITITPGAPYDAILQSGITVYQAANLVFSLTITQVMAPVSYQVVAGTVAYTGLITVQILDKEGVSVYMGNAQTQSFQILASRFPLSVTVTPAAPKYQTYTQTNIVDGSQLKFNLNEAVQDPTVDIKYAVFIAGVPYTGGLSIVIKDQFTNVIYSGSATTYTTTILQSRLPLYIVAKPDPKYNIVTLTNVTQVTNLEIDLLPVTGSIPYDVGLVAVLASTGGVIVLAGIITGIVCLVKARKGIHASRHLRMSTNMTTSVRPAMPQMQPDTTYTDQMQKQWSM